MGVNRRHNISHQPTRRIINRIGCDCPIINLIILIMKTIKIKLYEFDELSKEVQEKVIENNRDINTDYDWYKYTLEEEGGKLEALGYTSPEINFSGFYSQGDGACFSSGLNIKLWLEANKKQKEYKTAYKLSEYLSGRITTSGHYSHSGTMSVSLDSDYDRNYYDTNRKLEDKLNSELVELEADILNMARNEADRIYKVLEKEYEALTSSEAIIETLEANEYTFEDNGRMRNE